MPNWSALWKPWIVVANWCIKYVVSIEKRNCTQLASFLLIVDCLSWFVCIHMSCVYTQYCFRQSVNKAIVLCVNSINDPVIKECLTEVRHENYESQWLIDVSSTSQWNLFAWSPWNVARVNNVNDDKIC